MVTFFGMGGIVVGALYPLRPAVRFGLDVSERVSAAYPTLQETTMASTDDPRPAPPLEVPPESEHPFFRGEIEAPHRTDPLGSGLVLTIVALYAASGPLPRTAMPGILALLLVSTLVGCIVRSPYAVHSGLVTLLSFAVVRIPGILTLWPLSHVITLASYGAIVWSSPWLRKSSGWYRRGQVDRTSWVLVVSFATASAIALIVWRFSTTIDLTSFRSFVPKGVPVWTIPIGIVAFAMLNATFEEIIWRGVLMHSLEAAIGPGKWTWLLQGVGFGLWHYSGFPSGWVGVGLATIFALMMGVLRIRGRGMLAPWIAHSFADATIYILVAAMVLAR